MKRKLFNLMLLSLCIGFASCGEENVVPENFPAEHVVDDDGVPSGTPGNESMFGIYSKFGTNSDIWNSLKDTGQSYVNNHLGERSEWENHYQVFNAIWIVDEKTIYWVEECMMFSRSHPSSDEESILLELEKYTVNYQHVVVGRLINYTDTYYLTHYVYKWRDTDAWEGRYAMDGSKMIIHTDQTSKRVDGKEYVAVDYNTLTWDYSDGTIDVNGTKYKKVY